MDKSGAQNGLPSYIETREASLALKVEERTLKRMLVDGRLPVPYLRIGRQVRINEQAFRDWLADQEADSLSSNMAWKEGW